MLTQSHTHSQYYNMFTQTINKKIKTDIEDRTKTE